MSLNLRELREWPPEIADLAGATRDAAANHTSSADFYRSLAAASTWEGDGGSAARAAMVASAGEHDGAAENLAKAATSMEHSQQAASHVAQTIKGILDYAAQQPTVHIDEATNQVVPPDTSYLDEDAVAKIAVKVADLQAQIADALADGERVDAELAGAIATATGTPVPEAKTASSAEDLLVPGSGQPKAPRPADGASQPDSLGGALDQLAGQPVPQSLDGPAVSVPLDPKKVEEFKTLARQAMTREGIPQDEIEARLDAMVAAAQKPLPSYTPAKPDAMPPPGFGEGFADTWFGTEQGVKNLIGQGGPGAPGVLESWRDLIKSTNDQLTNPVGTAVDEVKRALDSPSLAYYLGGKTAEGAIAAPGLIFGGEGALIARAGALDDIAAAGAIPRGLVDGPVEHHSSLDSDLPTTLAADHPPPRVWDYSDGYSEHAPVVASNLNDAFVNGQPTADLARELADLSTHHMPSPTPDMGNADRVVLGKWAGMDGGYIGEAHANGGIYFDTGDDTWNAMGHGLSDEHARTVTWQVNQEFLLTQMENRVSRIDYIVPDGFDSVEQVAAVQRRSFSALEINFLKENAEAFGYKQHGNSWVYEGGN